MTAKLLKRDPDVISAEVDGKPLLLSVRTWTYLSCDPVGTRIWDHLAQPLDREALVQALLDEYEGDEAQIREDVADFLARLQDEGFLDRL